MMSRNLNASLLLALAATASLGQQAAAPAASAARATDCVPRHDHGAERGTPSPQARCGSASQAKAKKQGKAIDGHNHGKIHKNQ